MDIREYLCDESEKPLDRIVKDGGFTSIFRTLGCIGDSLASGEFEIFDENGRHCVDVFGYSWGQYIARAAGLDKVYNFSRGGMTAREYCESFAEAKGFWDPEKRCQAYVIALGCNDFSWAGETLGTIDDICPDDPEKNAKTFAGYYGKIIRKYKEISPFAKFFLLTFPKNGFDEEKSIAQRDLLYKIANIFTNCYVIDLYEYGPDYGGEFKERFFMNGHMNPAGYKVTADIIMSYIDYIVRKNYKDFDTVGLFGTDVMKDRAR